MIGIIATFTVQADHAAAFETAIKNFVSAVKANEPGTVVYDFFKVKGKENTYVMMEQYIDQAALDAHGKTAHMKALLPVVGPMLAGGVDMQMLTGIA